MSRYVHDGLTRVQWVPTLSSTSAPTATQLNAGTNLTPFITKDGLKTPQDQNTTPSDSLAETFDAKVVGTWGGDIDLTMKRDNETDTAWDLSVYGTNGFLVIRRGFAQATTFAADDLVEVYPAEMHQPVPAGSASNAHQTFTLKLAVTAEPNLKATVA